MPPQPKSAEPSGLLPAAGSASGESRGKKAGGGKAGSLRESRQARICDREIAPLWTQRFGRMLLRDVGRDDLGHRLVLVQGLAQGMTHGQGRATALDVFCGTGDVSLGLGGLGDLRVIAIDPSAAMLEVARQKAGPLAGRRVFFRSEPAEPRLPFAADIYDLVVSNLGLLHVAEPRLLLAEMVRVARPGARVAATLPLRGSFAEFHELFEQVLGQLGDHDALRRLSDHQARQLPSPGEARSWLVEAGLRQAHVEIEHFTLLFAGGRDFFFAPVIEYGPLPQWKDIAGDAGAPMQDIFRRLRDAIDGRCRPIGASGPGHDDDLPAQLRGWPQPFAVTVRAACLSGRKPLMGEPPPSFGATAVDSAEGDELNTAELDMLGLLRE